MGFIDPLKRFLIAHSSWRRKKQVLPEFDESADGRSRYRGEKWNLKKLHRFGREGTAKPAVKCDDGTCQFQAENLQRL